MDAVSPSQPTPLTPEQLKDIQGDVWSRGFPKDYETYYFFKITDNNEKIFARNLKKLVPDSGTAIIPSLQTVKDLRSDLGEQKEQAQATAARNGLPTNDVHAAKQPIANALIAFTRNGLDKLQLGLNTRQSLDVSDLLATDKSFCDGMAKDRVALQDPPQNEWDDVFKETIHGVFKIAGSSEAKVSDLLSSIENIFGTSMKDASSHNSSRVKGLTRPGAHRGKEHFGFQDNISQPLMNGIDVLEPAPGPPDNSIVNLNTEPRILIVTEETFPDSKTRQMRPPWMYNGSFLVFRKLEQDVQRFDELTDEFQTKKCLNEAHMGAKLMGRWPNGAPLAMQQYNDRDEPDVSVARTLNHFGYPSKTSGQDAPFQPCPFSAHIRKTNPRTTFGDQSQHKDCTRTRIIRNGIPYGPEYNPAQKNDGLKRGLLFACYQGRIEDGFKLMQGNWANKDTFIEGAAMIPGHDPIIGQADGGMLTTNFTDAQNKDVVTDYQTVKFPQLVKLKGGEYFFVPSITALKVNLSDAAA